MHTLSFLDATNDNLVTEIEIVQPKKRFAICNPILTKSNTIFTKLLVVSKSTMQVEIEHVDGTTREEHSGVAN